MMEKVYKQMALLCFLLLLLHKTACESYYIVPSEESDCPVKMCTTFSQLAANSSEYLRASSTVFIAPGSHSLNVKLTVTNIEKFTMLSNSTSTFIECTPSGYLYFKSIRNILIQDLKFVGCQDNIIESVQDFVLQNSTFESRDVSRTVLQLSGTSVTIDSTSFTSNHSDIYKGKIMFSQSHKQRSRLPGTVVVGIHSNITLNGYITFTNCSPYLYNGNSVYGGALAAFHSNIFFNGVCEMKENYALNGGGIFASQSKLFVNGELSVINNRAENNGGGLYLDQSELNCDQRSITTIMRNHAAGSGGGIYAVSSSIKMTVKLNYLQNKSMSVFNSQAVVEFLENRAIYGGALSLNSDSKLYILEYIESLNEPHENGTCFVTNTVSFTSNTADYGGAVYVNDDTNSNNCSDSLDSRFEEVECFIQIVPLHSFIDTEFCTIYFDFSNDSAEIAGSILFGGQLDKCKVSPFSRGHMHQGKGLTSLEEISSGISEQAISSYPVQLCHCTKDHPNCSYKPDSIKVQKGEDFMMLVVAVDQVGHPVNSTIQARLKLSESELMQGQVIQTGICTNLMYGVISHSDSETLMLHTPSSHCNELLVNIQFLPCTCPVGFQPSDINTKQCLCQCHNDIRQYVKCSSSTNSFKRLSNVWISSVSFNNSTGYLIFPHCPFDYCIDIGNNESVNLNQLHGSDAQCASSRTGLLCGSCLSGLSLSLGSSRCLLCPIYWPVLLISITIAAILAGIALVTVVLVLNLTVAAGTLNALIFFANIVATHRTILLPFPESNFVTIFISWFNLEVGIDTCYFQGMDAYSKTWLQFLFPTYIILLVGAVIVVSAYSSRFSHLIGKKNPVATLATLVLLSYAKFLQTVIAIMIFGIIQYPSGSNEVVWLHDPTVKYFVGKHSALFFAAVFILLLGTLYTVLLLSWQWLLRLPKWWILKWTNNVKLHALMEAYHAPFTSKYRFWPGLLLLIRACLCLVDALNSSNNPQVAFTSITFTIGFIIILKAVVGDRIYKKWTFDVLEMSILFNLLFFTVFMWYTFDTDGNQEAIAYISVSIAFILLVLIVIYHVYTYTGVSSLLHGAIRCHQVQTEGSPQSMNVSTDTLRGTDYEIYVPSRPTHSVVESPVP